MSSDFKRCLDKRRIVKQTYSKKLVDSELETSKKDIASAKKSHYYCLKAALQALYADEELIEQSYIDDFDATMLLRETADYRADFTPEGASTSIESASRFIVKADEILQANSY